jgi:oligoribonuclease NrnB/cAMP/cGMP phosphodiesterase (DHH superfamily)
MKNILCLYHGDADGQACAAIVRHKLGPDVYLHRINYGDPVPWHLIQDADQVIVVDFSLPPQEMTEIAQNRQLTWIDHHQSAIQETGEIASDWPGLRDTSEAACVLTWQYYFPDQAVPRAVVLIGDRDIWRWEEAQTGPFNEGLYHRDSSPEHDELWKPLLQDDQELLQEIIREGEILYQARLEKVKRQVDGYGYEVQFEGYRTLAINVRGNGDLGARIRELGYAIGYCYVDVLQEGGLMTKVTLFSDQVDVSKLAQKFGGGGHPGAAGFDFPRNQTPFPSQAEVQKAPDDKSGGE